MGIFSFEHGRAAYRADFAVYTAAVAGLSVLLLALSPSGRGVALLASLLAGLLVFRLLLLVEQCHERHLLVLKLRDVKRQLEEKRQPHLRLHRRLVGFDPHSQLQRRRRLPPPLHRRHVQRHKGRFSRQLRNL